MSDNYCPDCGEVLPLEAINIQEGVALCPACGVLSRLSVVVEQRRPLQDVVTRVPPGCSIQSDGTTIDIRVSLRSFAGFVGALAICLFWNGIVSVFVLLAASSLYQHLIGPLPAWFPAPDMKDGMPLGMTFFLCIFLIPFVTIGAILIGAVLINLAGGMRFRLGETEATVETGIGFLQWRQRFDPTAVHRIEEGATSWEINGSNAPLIEIHADRTVKFGSLLTQARREWIRGVLQALLVKEYARYRDQVLDLAASPAA